MKSSMRRKGLQGLAFWHRRDLDIKIHSNFLFLRALEAPTNKLNSFVRQGGSKNDIGRAPQNTSVTPYKNSG